MEIRTDIEMGHWPLITTKVKCGRDGYARPLARMHRKKYTVIMGQKVIDSLTAEQIRWLKQMYPDELRKTPF